MNQEQTQKPVKKRPSFMGRMLRVLLKHAVIAVIALACSGVAVMFAMDQIVMPYITNAGKKIVASNLTGLTVEEAEVLAKRKGFRVLSRSMEYNMDYSENTISFQYPGPGSTIKPGRLIRVIVSLGPRPISMPDVVGRSRRDAGYIMKSLGVGDILYEWVHSNDHVRGIIASQNPVFGEEIPEDSGVVLYISDGIPETTFIMPDLIELSLTAAFDTLKTYSFEIDRVTLQREDATELLPDTIIDQHPDPGTPMNVNTVVELVVSTSQ